MKPAHIKEQRKKEVRKIHKRFREIYEAQKALGYIKLEKPIRHGWYKEIVITRKVSRYKNKKAILEIYEKIEKTFWGRTKEEADKKWFQQVSVHLIYRDFPTISKRQFNKLSEQAQQLCTPYRFKTKCKKWKTRFYIRIPKAAYTIKYTRAYITHSKRIDPALESEDDLLSQQLLKKEYYNISQGKWRHERYWKSLESKKEQLKTRKDLKALKKHALEDLLKDNISWEIN